MGVRKTESRIPANFQASDLGQAAVSGDGRCALVSFVSNPIVVGRENVYVLFVTDAGLASASQNFEWTFTMAGGAPEIRTTEVSEAAFTPGATGSLSVLVRALGAGNAEQARVEMQQEAVALNAVLETMINGGTNEPGPGVGSPEVARELVNDHNPYYHAVSLQNPESGNGFKRFVYSMVSEGALQRGPARRKKQIGQLAASLNGDGGDFAALAKGGAGICGIRLALLAMTVGSPPPLPWTELPAPATQRAVADEVLRKKLAALDENTRIDLFNLVRFPKSNITQCGRILESLRDRYFGSTNFDDVLSGMSGTRAHWISKHFEVGPVLHG